MSLYVDASAFLKLYFEESDSEACEAILGSDASWLTARLTSIEVRRNLARELKGRELAQARDQFRRDWDAVAVIELSEDVCDAAADIAETLGVRTLDALHLGSAQRAGGGQLSIVTYDLRQAQGARALGWTVLGS